MSQTTPTSFDEQTLSDAIAQQDTPVLVDFWAPWCAPCRALAPTIDSLAERFEGRATVGKVNVDDHADIAARYAIQSIPTVVLFKGGEEVKRFVGIQSEDDFAAAIESAEAAPAG